MELGELGQTEVSITNLVWEAGRHGSCSKIHVLQARSFHPSAEFGTLF